MDQMRPNKWVLRLSNVELSNCTTFGVSIQASFTSNDKLKEKQMSCIPTKCVGTTRLKKLDL